MRQIKSISWMKIFVVFLKSGRLELVLRYLCAVLMITWLKGDSPLLKRAELKINISKLVLAGMPSHMASVSSSWHNVKDFFVHPQCVVSFSWPVCLIAVLQVQLSTFSAVSASFSLPQWHSLRLYGRCRLLFDYCRQGEHFNYSSLPSCDFLDVHLTRIFSYAFSTITKTVLSVCCWWVHW